jgi:hypothetical protein
MKVVCLDNTRGNTRHLEVNKVYDTVELTEHHKRYPVIGAHYVIKIFNEEIWVKKKYMITLEEWRQQKLDKLI